MYIELIHIHLYGTHITLHMFSARRQSFVHLGYLTPKPRNKVKKTKHVGREYVCGY